MGLCCTIIWVVIILAYATQKIDILINKKDVSVLGSKKLSFFSDEVFSFKEGLNIAVAYTGYDGEQEWSLDPRHGTLTINAYEWGFREDLKPFTNRFPLETHSCTR